ncbi:MAG TPA: kelch repeat-containing protein [Candidatus Sulfotelmatobacter sp.]|nr:kelch repeat-containing protein [Candidatus Sulfotelmatobacter sp.]
MNTTLPRTPLFFTSVLTALALICAAGQAEAAASAANDPSGTWTATGALVGGGGGYGCAATNLPDGNVLLVSAFAISEVYEVASGKWTITSPLNEERWGPTVILLPNGKALAAGGWNSRHALLSSAELFDPASRTWTNTGAMLSVHYKHTATLLPNGKVLVTGNNYRTNEAFVTVRVTVAADGASGRTTRTIDRPTGKGMAAGDEDRANDFASAELYDPATGTWKRTASLKQPRGHHTATLLTNGLVLVVGGYGKQGTALSSAELYDPTAETWTEVGGLELARGSHTATLLPDGKVLVAGGEDGSGAYLREAELFDPVSDTWTAAKPMLWERSYHTATLLQNGKVLAAGGFGPVGSLRFVEVYDPATGAWTRPKPMAVARFWHTATLMPSGKVLIAGGAGADLGDPLSSTELFDPRGR